MSGIFISHSSLDKDFARRLQSDLNKMGFETWLDEKNIRVGDSIVDKIDEGLRDADHVILVLSANSVNSEWVKREWQTTYMAEAEQKRTILLPVCIDRCDVPHLLKTKKHADLSQENYAVGFVELVGSISPVLKSDTSKRIFRADLEDTSKFGDLLSGIYTRTTPLSALIAKVLVVAEQKKRPALATFCRNELTGWATEGDTVDADEISYRHVLVVLSPWKANFQYIGWSQNAHALIEHVKNQEYSLERKYFFNQPVSKIEELARRTSDSSGVIFFETHSSALIPNPEIDFPLFGYAVGSSYIDLLETIRSELAKRLLTELPSVG